MKKISVIKIGGNIIDHPEKLQRFLQDFAKIEGAKVLIHGGGKIATEMSKTLGIVPQMVDGRRITNAETLKVVTMVYAGLINKNVVVQLQSFGCNAIGVCGADGNCIPSKKRSGTSIDYGFVGDPLEDGSNPTLSLLLENGLIPIVAPITHDTKGNLLNTNADTIASTVARQLAHSFETHLLYCFEKKGVLKNIEDENSVISQITPQDFATMKANKTIFEGMIPKLENAFASIDKGVKSVRILAAEDMLIGGGTLMVK